MIITKYLHGYVAQRYDSETNKCLDQEFVLGLDDIQWEDENGEEIDPAKMSKKPYFPSEMIQPEPIAPKMSDEDQEKFDELLGYYVEYMTENIDMGDMMRRVASQIEAEHKNYTLEALTAKIKEYCPVLLEYLEEDELEEDEEDEEYINDEDEYKKDILNTLLSDEDEDEQQRRDEKNGLYPEHWDDCN
jgi:hypothetical protein